MKVCIFLVIFLHVRSIQASDKPSFLFLIETEEVICTGVLISRYWLWTNLCLESETPEQLKITDTNGGKHVAVKIVRHVLDQSQSLSIDLIELKAPEDEGRLSPLVVSRRDPLRVRRCALYTIQQDMSISAHPVHLLSPLSCDYLYRFVTFPQYEFCSHYSPSLDPGTASPLVCDGKLLAILTAHAFRRSARGEGIGVFLRSAPFIDVIKYYVPNAPVEEASSCALSTLDSSGFTFTIVIFIINTVFRLMV